jgi:hypothetical protein
MKRKIVKNEREKSPLHHTFRMLYPPLYHTLLSYFKTISESNRGSVRIYHQLFV